MIIQVTWHWGNELSQL